MNLAPIILFVYNRPWHTEQTLNALMQNDQADESVLYIYADGPKENATEKQIENIKKVRQIIRKKQWCREIHFLESDKNKGLANSIIDGVTEIINEFGKVIVLEDDIITSIGFLKYMNDALDLYQYEAKVKSISGYLEPIKYKGKFPFFLSKGSSWGWATWRRVWNEIEWDSTILLNYFNTKKSIEHFNFSGYPYYEMLQDQDNGKIDSWAIRFYASSSLNNGLHLTPPGSLTFNSGFDGSGTHCGFVKTTNPLNVLTGSLSVKKIPLRLNQKVPLQIKSYRENPDLPNQKRTLRKSLIGIRNRIIQNFK